MTDRRTTRQLFKEWRSGDAEAGNAMAQQVADWYYAIATSRLGEARGRGPCDDACQAFGAGIVEVTDSRKVVTWAHGLIAERVKASGSRAQDGNDPSAYTGKHRPKELLLKARAALPEEVRLLEVVYGADADRSQIDALSEPMGGNPLGILTARYRVKRWLRDSAGIGFEVAPEKPVLDRAPLPLYEADRMASTQEEAQFEEWMLSDLDLCKDIAEFAHFSIALRGGLPEKSAEPVAPVSKAGPPPAAVPEDVTAVPESSSGSGRMVGIIVGVVAVLFLLGVLGTVVLAVIGGFFAG